MNKKYTRDLIKSKLNKREKILWSKRSDGRETNSKQLALYIGAGFIFTGFCYASIIGFIIAQVFFFFCLAIYGPVAYFYNEKFKKEKYKLFVLTSKKIMVIASKKVVAKSMISYNDISNCELIDYGPDNAALVIQKGKEKILFNDVRNLALRDAKKIVIKQIFKSGSCKVFINNLLDLAWKYKLRYKETKELNGLSTLTGKIENLDSNIEIKGMLPVESFLIKIEGLPNFEDNSLRIRLDEDYTLLQKTRIQDLEIGDEEVDKPYILESNDLHFLQTILTEEIRILLKKQLGNFNGIIEFGTYRKSKKSKRIKTKFRNPKDNLDVLDAHLVEEDITSVEVVESKQDEQLTSTIELQSVNENDFHGEDLSKDLKQKVELMQLLTKAIKNYYA